jgi:hypothetical protein
VDPGKGGFSGEDISGQFTPEIQVGSGDGIDWSLSTSVPVGYSSSSGNACAASVRFCDEGLLANMSPLGDVSWTTGVVDAGVIVSERICVTQANVHKISIEKLVVVRIFY